MSLNLALLRSRAPERGEGREPDERGQRRALRGAWTLASLNRSGARRDCSGVEPSSEPKLQL
jgi:hypothetical protein